MSDSGRSMSIPVPNLRQWLIFAAVAGCVWLFWQDRQASQKLRALRDPKSSPTERVQSVEAWVTLGEEGVPQLIEALSDSDARTRRDAAWALGRIGERARSALPALRTRLLDEDGWVRANAVLAIGRVGGGDERIIEEICGLVGDDDDNVRRSSELALAEIGPAAVPYVIETLSQTNVHGQVATVHVLHRLAHQSAAAVEGLENVQRHPAGEVREVAIRALLAMRRASIDDVRRWIMDERWSIVDAALTRLVELGDRSVEAIPELSRRLEDDDPRIVSRVLQVAASLGSAGRPMVPVVRALLNRGAGVPRGQILRTLAEIGAGVEQLADVALPILTADDRWDSWSAGNLLLQAAPDEARRQIPVVLARLRTESGDVSWPALFALSAMSAVAEEAVPELIRLLDENNPEIQRVAISTLGGVGQKASDAVPKLVVRLQEWGLNSDQSRTVVRSLGLIGQASRPALPMLLERMGRYEPMPDLPATLRSVDEMRLDVIAAVGRIAGEDPEVRAALRGLLADFAYEVRMTALRTLVEVEPDSERWEDLQSGVRDESSEVRAVAAELFGESRGSSEQVVESLVNLLKDEDPFVRTAAAIALGRHGPEAKSAIPALTTCLDDRRNSRSNREVEADRTRTAMGRARRFAPPLWKLSVSQAVREALMKIESGAADSHRSPR